jgi:hypothetical protein
MPPDNRRASVDPPDKQTSASAFGKLPIAFEKNEGQTDRRVDYLARGPGYLLFLNGEEAVWNFKDSAAPKTPAASTLSLSLPGANKHAKAKAEALLPGHSNYFIGSGPSKWVRNIPNYSRVHYMDVYPGIDLVYYGNPQQLEYDFVVAPGADPDPIRLRFSGADDARIDADGNLILVVAGRPVVQRKPVVYQSIEDKRVSVAGSYVLDAGATEGAPLELTFALGDFDPAYALVIDPVLVYSTYLSGSSYEEVLDMAVDDSGHVFVTGWTLSTDFPVIGGLSPGQGGQNDPGRPDVFIAKLNPEGNGLVYSTYLAGNDIDMSRDLAIDAAGAAYVTGYTSSNNFPVAGGLPPEQAGAPDGSPSPFVVKLSPAGDALLYSTYLAAGNGYDEAFALAVDGGGNAYVTGWTSPPYVFPILGGLSPDQGGLPDGGEAIFIAKLNPAGDGLVYSTYLSGSEYDWAFDIAVDDVGQAYVGCMTTSMNMPRIGGLSDDEGGAPQGWEKSYFAKLNAEGNALVYSTYLAALSPDGYVISDALALDAAGSLYATGRTGVDFPVVGGLPPEQGGQPGGDCCTDLFIAKFNPAGDALVYSTYLSGNYIDGAYGIAVDPAGLVHLAGQTNSTNFPQLSGLPPDQGGTPFEDDGSWGANGPPACAFVSTLNPAGNALVSSTYLCGNSTAWTLARGGDGDIYVAGFVGDAPGIPFPIVGGLPPGQGGTQMGGVDAFVAKLTTNAPLVSIERAWFDATPTQGDITVAVVRSGPLDDALTVDFATADGTAVADLHYESASGTLLWPSGDGTPRFVSIVINSGAPVGGEDPYFHLQLSNGTGAVIGTPDIARITIPIEDAIFADGFE